MNGQGTCPGCNVTFHAAVDGAGMLTCPLCDTRFQPQNTPPLSMPNVPARDRTSHMWAGVVTLGVMALVVVGIGVIASGGNPSYFAETLKAIAGERPALTIEESVKVEPAPAAKQEIPAADAMVPPEDTGTVTLAWRVNRAIDRGLVFLRGELGRLPDKCRYLSLVGLTLLECGAAADDPGVQRVAEELRTRHSQIQNTYELSLAIMFLDRLGRAGDRSLIQNFGDRLLRAQLADGTWTYRARPIINNANAKRARSGKVQPQTSGQPRYGLPDYLPRYNPWDSLPVYQPFKPVGQPQRKPQPPRRLGPQGDHSNTQFAVLGLWIAARHGVPAREALKKAEQHFLEMQNDDGSWSYRGPGTRSRDSMTCAALMALALGQGADLKYGGRDAGPERTRMLARGFGFLQGTLKRPANPRGRRFFGAEAGSDLYFLWSLDRLAMAYRLKAIGTTAWYPWAAEMIVAAQEPNGCWLEHYGGHIDTCFALLVLKRSNLTEDLSKMLAKARGPNGTSLLPAFVKREDPRTRATPELPARERGAAMRQRSGELREKADASSP